MKLLATIVIWLWAFSIIKATISMKKFNKKLYKDLNEKEYKIVPEKIEEIEKIVGDQLSKGTQLEPAILLCPLYNLLFMNHRKKKYQEKKQQLFDKLEEQNIIKKMDAYDRNFFRNVIAPSTFSNIFCSEVGHNNFPLILKMKNNEQIGQVLFTTNYDMSSIEILMMDNNALKCGHKKIENHIRKLTNKYDNRDLFVEALNQYNENPESITEQKKRLLRLKKELLIHKYYRNNNKPVYQIKKKI